MNPLCDAHQTVLTNDGDTTIYCNRPALHKGNHSGQPTPTWTHQWSQS